MKLLFTVFIFTILLKVQHTYSLLEVGDVTINDDTNENGLENTFRKGYGDHLLKISQLNAEQISSMIPHLEAIANAAKGNSLGSIFQYLQELCAEHTKLNLLNKVTDNIKNFVTESGYNLKSKESNTKLTPRKVFSPTSIDENTEEIKAAFDEIDTNLKKGNANSDRDEAVKKAENRRTEAMEKIRAKQQTALEENELAMQKIEEEYKKAYEANEDMCRNAISKSEEEYKQANREYDEIRKKADETLQQAMDDYKSVTEAVEEEYQSAVADAADELEDAKKDYHDVVEQGYQQFEEAKNKAATRRQTSINQYESTMNGRLSDKMRSTMEKAMSKADVAFQQAINRAQSEFNKLEENASKEFAKAQNDYEKALRLAENEANVAYSEAENLKAKASDDYRKILSAAEIDLDKKEQLAEAKKLKTCRDDRYKVEDKADKERFGAIKRVQAQQIEIQNEADRNFERIDQEYHEEIDTIMQKYHDTWSKADALEEEIGKKIQSQNRASREAAKNKRSGGTRRRKGNRIATR